MAKIASRFGKGSCLVCFAILGRFSGFGGKRFSRENATEMTELERDFCESGKSGEKWEKGAKLPPPKPPQAQLVVSRREN